MIQRYDYELSCGNNKIRLTRVINSQAPSGARNKSPLWGRWVWPRHFCGNLSINLMDAAGGSSIKISYNERRLSLTNLVCVYREMAIERKCSER